ncbi:MULTISPECIES: hypothetical protein [Actinoplanes]|uniref:hypothetical protein n=1 Tax=Actinoplanes TaxID=1865 RepID=UPI000696A25C|nr:MULTISPECIES: hypothetical protein [Actinoplanes]GLY04928.1 hypothetical protein Acsp01_53070 [Actinoplanes sp. NBRC 101535]
MSEEVVNFGSPDPESGEPRGRSVSNRVTTFLHGLRADRRLPVLTAGLGAVALFASLVSEWQVTTVEGISYSDEDLADRQILPADLIDLGGIAAGYLGGLFLLVIAVVLTLFGPPAGRRYAKLTGLATGGLLTALLMALVQLLGSETRLVSRYFTMQLDTTQTAVAYGRGLWCALAGVAAAMIALGIGDRTDAEEEAPLWSRDDEDEDEPEVDEPLDLTITSSTPFAAYPDQPGQPHRS